MKRRYRWWLAPSALLTLLLLAPTYVGVDTSSVQTISNKIFDRTNTFQTYTNIQLYGAMCSNVTALTYWELPTSAAPLPACDTGSNTQKATLDYSSSSANSAQSWIQIPQGFNISNISSAEVLWKSAGSGAVVWQLATACTANNGTQTDNPSFNTANTVTSSTSGGSVVQSAAISALTMTGCATGYVLHVKLSRTPGSGGDTLSGGNAAKMLLVRLRIPREG